METTFFLHKDEDNRSNIRFRPLVQYDPYALKKGEMIPPLPFEVRIDKGRIFKDILWLQDIFNFYISDRIYRLLMDHEVTGWRGYPITILGRGEKYWGIQVISRAAAPIRPREGFIKGLDFDRSTWDGSDIFILTGTMFTLFSQQLRDLLQKHKTSGLVLEEISTISWYNSNA